MGPNSSNSDPNLSLKKGGSSSTSSNLSGGDDDDQDLIIDGHHGHHMDTMDHHGQLISRDEMILRRCGEGESEILRRKCEGALGGEESEEELNKPRKLRRSRTTFSTYQLHELEKSKNFIL